MKLLTKNTDYAVRALVKIAALGGEPVPASRIAKEDMIPYAYLRRLLNTLKDRKILRSTEGKGGGFVLGRKPEEIFLTDVMQVFQGEVNLTECMFRRKICHNRATCVLRHKIREIERKVIGDLEGISIGMLLKETRG